MFLLRWYVAKLPKLRAHDALTHAQATAVGSGAMASAAQRSVIREWEQLAQPEALRAIKASPDMLAAAGIGVAP